MKYLSLSVACLLLFLYPNNAGFSQTKWYNLHDNEQYITNFKLYSGSTKTFAINSNTEIWVGFKSDATHEQFQKYKRFYPIELAVEGLGSFSDLYGGGSMLCKPVDGKIKITVSNNSQHNFKIVIFTKEKIR
jgi:hypothetical protein